MKQIQFFQVPPTYEAYKKQFFIQIIMCCNLLIIYIVVSIILGHLIPFGVIGVIMFLIFLVMIPVELKIYKKKYESGKIKINKRET